MSDFVLVPSPLTGSMTWSLVAEELRHKGHRAVVPVLPRADRVGPPYWRALADAVAIGEAELEAGSSVVLVGHSGAGPRLPCFREAGRAASAYLFVDAGLPGVPPDRAWLKGLEKQAQDGWVPSWPEEALRDEIPHPLQRAALMAEMPPRWPLALFGEPAPIFDGWPDAPCAYLSLTDRYPESVAYAEEAGWPLFELSGSHFEMLNDAPSVTQALLDLVEMATRQNDV